MSEKGFGLIEAIVALVVLGIVLAAIVPSFTGYLNITSRAELRSQAVVVAQRTLESLRRQTISSLPGSSGGPATVGPVSAAEGGRTFEVITVYCQRAELCNPTTRQIRVQVRHANRLVYEVETVYTQLNTQ